MWVTWVHYEILLTGASLAKMSVCASIIAWTLAVGSSYCLDKAAALIIGGVGQALALIALIIRAIRLFVIARAEGKKRESPTETTEELMEKMKEMQHVVKSIEDAMERINIKADNACNGMDLLVELV